MQHKERLDVLLVSRGLSESREKAKATIMAGLVFVDNQRVDKAGTKLPVDVEITVKGNPIPYVGRGGLKLEKAMEEKEAEFDDILKMGRTQLQDAVPMRLGQGFGAFAHVLKRDIKRLKNVMDEMKVLNIGATAIGTAINVDSYYLANISYELSKVAGISLKQADDLIDATQNLDGFVSVSGVLEINLPARQNGSSIMPGKINPVIPEVVSQVAYLIIGHDYTITMAAEAGQCEEYIEKSVGISTALCPYIGYAKSAEIAKKSLKTGISVKELVLEEGLLKEEELKEILKPEKMTQPMREKVMKAVS